MTILGVGVLQILSGKSEIGLYFRPSLLEFSSQKSFHLIHKRLKHLPQHLGDVKLEQGV